jgi:5-methyltetrahydrofolate--homocysteine methyltransferase
MLLGTDIAASSTILAHLGVDIAGLNCSTGPEHMREPVRYLTEHVPLPISTIPNAGLPLNVGGKAVYPMKPEPMAEALCEFVSEFGVNIVGGCCGTTPPHIQALTEQLAALGAHQRRRPAERVAHFDLAARDQLSLLVASAVRANSLKQVPAL